MKKQLIIWDWNGTLIDDTEFCFSIANRMRVERNMPPLPDVEAYRDLFRFPVEEYYKLMGYTFETEPFLDVSREFVQLYYEGYASCPLRNHAVETIRALKQRGLKQAILSATGSDRLLCQVERFGIAPLFDRIMGTNNNFGSGKADIAHTLLADMDVLPEQALFVGDTDHDLAVAKSVGCEAVLLFGGHQSAKRLRALNAPTLTNVRELLELID